MLSLFNDQMFLNLRVVNTEPAIPILNHLYTRDLIVNLKFSAHYVCSTGVHDGFFCIFSGLILDEYPSFTPSFFVLLPDDLHYFTILAHEVLQVNER